MKKRIIIRLVITLTAGAAALFFVFQGDINISLAILFSLLVILPIVSVNLLFDSTEKHQQNTDNLDERFQFKMIWLAVLLFMGILFPMKGGESLRYSGMGMVTGVIAGGFIHFRNYRKQKQKLKEGEILWDERDLKIAGEAARSTLNFSILLLALAMLAFYVFSPNLEISPFIILGISTAVVSGCYTVLYRIKKRRNN